MNAYYQNEHITSLGERELYRRHTVTVGDRLISFICFLAAIFTNATVVKVEKAVLSTAGVFIFFGVIGSMDCGRLGLLAGLLICGLVVLVEFFILRSIWRRR